MELDGHAASVVTPPSGGEERQVGLALAAEQREIDLDTADAARLRERDRLRLQLLRGEDPAAAAFAGSSRMKPR